MQGIKLLSSSPTITPTPALELERGESKEQMELEGESSLPDNKVVIFLMEMRRLRMLLLLGLVSFSDLLMGWIILLIVGTLGAIVHG